MLTACGIDTPVANKPGTFENASGVGVHSETGEWIGLGGIYKLESTSTPKDAVDVIAYDNEIYYIRVYFEDGMKYTLQDAEGQALYATEAEMTGMAACEYGIWVVEEIFADNKTSRFLLLISYSGKVVHTIETDSFELGFDAQSYITSILYSDDKLYLVCEDKLMILEASGKLFCVIELPMWYGFTLVQSGDGGVYVKQQLDLGVDIFEIDIKKAELRSLLSLENGAVYSGGNSNFLIMETADGLYNLARDGETSPIVIWRECAISVGQSIVTIAVSDGKYYCMFSHGAYMLVPTDTLDMGEKTRLVIATIWPSWLLQSSVSRFNNYSTDYYVEIIDYSEDGVYTEAQALTKLNTQIISGNPPDMLGFPTVYPYESSPFSPNTYISKDYLMDISEYFDSDIGIDDLTIANALLSEGGVYYVANSFVFETLVGLHSRFGSQDNWTLSEYLSIEAANPPDTWTLYNTVKERFLYQLSSRYINTAIDWETGTCNFDNDAFIEILETSDRIRENPEDLNNPVFGLGAELVADGKLVAALCWIDEVWDFAFDEHVAGEALSVIGWPTVEGVSGSNIYLYDPIGIVSQSPNGAGSWEFIKFMLKDTSLAESGGLPMYMPILEEMVEDAKHNTENPVLMTDEDAEKLFALLAASENIAIYDETVLGIIADESAAFFAGSKTAAETAKNIQSRVSIYVAEQS